MHECQIHNYFLRKKQAMDKWNKRFLNLAKHIAGWSKDPSTKVGAVIADNKNRIVSVGYNGFPAGVVDNKERYDDRNIKYELVQHSEINAILFAQRDLTNCTIYTYPIAPCTRCACAIIQSGISSVVSIEPSEEIRERWGESIDLSIQIFTEACVQTLFLKEEDLL
jgi:dCMP deaminase